MKVGFVTCVKLGLSCMEEIHAAGGSLQLAITLEDSIAVSKSGRVYIDEFCGVHGIELLKVRHINDDVAVDAVRSLDWLLIIGWSQIAGAAILGAPRCGVIGMHPTLLPVGRGRAAIPWAIIKGLRHTGVTMFKLDSGVDTGPVLAQESLPIDERETATSLYDRVERAHRSLIRRVWPDLVADRLEPEPQDERRATIWEGRRPEDGRLDADMAVDLADRLVRGCTRPYPGAFIDLGERRLRVWSAVPVRSDEAAPPDSIRLVFSGGDLAVTEYEWELLGSGPSPSSMSPG